MTIYSEQYYSSMDPQYSQAMSNAVWKNYYFGAPTDATKPLQIPSVMKLAQSGIMNVEVGAISADQWEQMPKEQFATIKRMAKLLIGDKAKLSVHAPVYPDATGFERQKWAKEHRENAVTLFKDVIDKAAMLQTDEKVPVNVTIHSSGHDAPPAAQFKWDYVTDPKTHEIKVDPKTGEKIKGLVEREKYVIDPESGDLQLAKAETIHYPTGDVIMSTDDRLAQLNHSQWLQKRQGISATNTELRKSFERLQQNLLADPIVRSEIMRLPEEQRAQAVPEIVESHMKTVLGTEEARARYSDQVQDWANNVEAVEQHFGSLINNTFDHTVKVLNAYVNTAGNKEEKEKWEEQLKKFTDLQGDYKKQIEGAVKRRDKAALATIQENVAKGAWKLIHQEETPLFIPVEKWSQYNGAQTFAELAMHSYDKFGEKGPIIVVENPLPHLAMGRGETLAAGLQKARELFVEKLVKEKKLPKSKAEEIAKEKIGATWDISHINILRRFGITDDKQAQGQMMKELQAIKGDIKHVHISDNFGFNDQHLAPGMGNAPIKEFLAALDKEGKLKKVTTILESFGVAAHLGLPPSHPEAMRYFRSPLYGWQTDANWGEAGSNYFFGSGGYSSGYGKILPDVHFSEYGAGFSQLPSALGGIRESERGKFAGTPMS